MKSLIIKILKPTLMPHWLQDLILALPRIIACYFLCTSFGWSKFPTPMWFIEDVWKLGLPFPAFFAWAAVLTEVFGAALLLLGFGSRIMGFLLTCTMLVAIFLQKWDNELWEKLPAMGFLWVAIFAMIVGSGRFGLDYLITKKK
jgi:putative oxidoreductase